MENWENWMDRPPAVVDVLVLESMPHGWAVTTMQWLYVVNVGGVFPSYWVRAGNATNGRAWAWQLRSP